MPRASVKKLVLLPIMAVALLRVETGHAADFTAQQKREIIDTARTVMPMSLLIDKCNVLSNRERQIFKNYWFKLRQRVIKIGGSGLLASLIHSTYKKLNVKDALALQSLPCTHYFSFPGEGDRIHRQLLNFAEKYKDSLTRESIVEFDLQDIRKIEIAHANALRCGWIGKGYLRQSKERRQILKLIRLRYTNKERKRYKPSREEIMKDEWSNMECKKVSVVLPIIYVTRFALDRLSRNATFFQDGFPD